MEFDLHYKELCDRVDVLRVHLAANEVLFKQYVGTMY